MSDEIFTVTATITVRVADAQAVHDLATAAGVHEGDERSELEGAVAAGLAELPALVTQYGFDVLGSEAHVTQAVAPQAPAPGAL
jgi:hypothetical protein